MTTNIQEQASVLQQYQKLRNKCLVYTRVMGYHRPVESFNIGKKGEHKQRTHFNYRHVKTDL